jgi:hypothetical protein
LSNTVSVLYYDLESEVAILKDSWSDHRPSVKRDADPSRAHFDPDRSPARDDQGIIVLEGDIVNPCVQCDQKVVNLLCSLLQLAKC